jgi:protein O-mannosyl-transferase
MLNKINISRDIQRRTVYIFLVIITLAVLGQVNQHDFILFDDNLYVTENQQINSGITLKGVQWAFSTTSIKQTGLWNPLIWLSLMLDYQLYGLNSGGYHLTNLILHVLSTLLLFWLLNRMTGTIWRGAFVAAFFALHPLHVESVAWISERKDVLSAFFWMLTLCLYVYYTEKPIIRRYILALFSFVCALLSKPMVVTLPAIMILLDYWPLGRFELKKGNLILWQLKEKMSFFVLSAVFSIIVLYYPHTPDMPDDPALKHLSLSSRLANAPVSFMTYLGKTFWPHDMAVFYPFSEHIPSWQIWGAMLLITVISIAVIIMAKRLPYLFVGWLWYAITIAPVIGIIQISLIAPYAMADRYTYLPSIGIAIMLAWGIPFLIKNENMGRKIFLPAVIIFLIIISVLTWQQCGYWKNSSILFSHASRVTNNNDKMYHNLGFYFDTKGRFSEAIYYFNKAIRIKPNHYGYYNSRGNAYASLGQNRLAMDDFNKSISLYPSYATAYYNRGTLYGKTGQYQCAIEDFNKAISLKNDYVKAYNNRGLSYDNLGQYQQAIENFNNAINIKPNYADAWNNRANVYLKQGNSVSGCRDVRRACDLGNCKAQNYSSAKSLCR